MEVPSPELRGWADPRDAAEPFITLETEIQEIEVGVRVLMFVL